MEDNSPIAHFHIHCTVSWNLLVRGRETTGQGGGLFCILHTWYSSEDLLISDLRTLLPDHSCLALLIHLSDFSTKECATEWWNLMAIYLLVWGSITHNVILWWLPTDGILFKRAFVSLSGKLWSPFDLVSRGMLSSINVMLSLSKFSWICTFFVDDVLEWDMNIWIDDVCIDFYFMGFSSCRDDSWF